MVKRDLEILKIGEVWRSAVVTAFFVTTLFFILSIVGPFHICGHCLFGGGNRFTSNEQSFLVLSLIWGCVPLGISIVLSLVFIPMRLFIAPPTSTLTALWVGTLVGFCVGMLLLFISLEMFVLVIVLSILCGIAYTVQSFVAYYKPVIPTPEDTIEPSSRVLLNRFRKASDWITWIFSPIMSALVVGYLWILYGK